MTVCAVKSCHNQSEKQHKSSGVTFHRFPGDPIIASRWIKTLRLCRKADSWNPTNSTRICSKHFDEKFMYTTKGGLRRLHRDAVPTKDLHICCSNYEETPSTEIQQEQSISQENDSDIENSSIIEVTPSIIEESPSINQRNLSIEELQWSSSQISPTETEDEMESLFDTPRKAALRRKLKKKTLLHVKHSKLIKTLRQKNRLLKIKNKALKEIINVLKNKNKILALNAQS